jgi:uncharacterized protein YecT (DUF1311 family)
VYALGLVGWEMLAGRRPWHGETLYSVLHRQQHDELPDLALLRPDIPAYLLAAVRGALAKNPDGRWRDGPEFLERLTPAPVALPAAPDLPDDASVVRADQTVRLAPTTTQPIDVGRAKSTGTRRLARRRRLAAAAAAVAVLGIGGAVVAQRQSAAAQRARDAAVTGVSDAQLDSLLRAAAAAAPFGGARAAPPRRPAAPATPAARTRAGQTGSTSPVPLPARRPDPGAAVRAAAAPVSTPVAALPPATAPDPPDATNATLAADAGSGRCASPADADQRACLLAAIEVGDAGLTRDYQALIAELRRQAGGEREPAPVAALRAEQRAWIDARDRQCRGAVAGRDGARWGAARAPCFAALSERRAAELRARLARASGDDST